MAKVTKISNPEFTEMVSRLFFLHFEWLALSAMLLGVIIINPESSGMSFCLWERAGITFCPGEGLGRSMSLLFRGEFAASFAMHPLGIFAVGVLITRIGSILRRNKHQSKPNHYE